MRRFSLAVCVAVWGWAGSVFGQQETVAEALFREARSQMKVKDYSAACPKLAESHRLDPSPGTLLNLAICEEKRGRMAVAWTKYEELLDTTTDADPRRAVAIERIQAIKQQIPQLRISVAGNPSDAVVLLDTIELHAASLGVEVPVDAGEHRIELLSKGSRVERVVNVAPGERLAVELLPVAATSSPPSQPPLSREPTPKQRAVPPRRHDVGVHGAAPRSARDLAFERAAYVVGGVGVAGLAAAAVLSGLSFKQKEILEAHCTGHDCDPQGIEAAGHGAALLRMADVALVTGVVGLATGGILLWQSKRTNVGMRLGPAVAAATVSVDLP
jgi:hypothetical protein